MIAGNKQLRIQFLGASGYVTGSRTLVETEETRLYVDAGLYQGPKYVEEKNFSPLESDPSTIDAIILTHAHVDHSGFTPLLVKKGFKGKIFCTKSTKDLLEIVLPDAGHIQEEEFKFFSKKKIAEHDLKEPLYTREDGLKVLELVEAVDFHQKVKFRDIEFEFFWAGHIVGAAYLRLEAGGKKVLFSGDIGPRHPVFHKKREAAPHADIVVMESTYGGRFHEHEDYTRKMLEAVGLAVRKKGMLLIPSFAVGRTQLILFVLFRMIKKNLIPGLPIFIDSPMATRATRVYLEYPEELNQAVIDEGFLDFMQTDNIRLIEDVVISKRLNYFNGPGIIISASGMCSGGRILHHLYNRIWDRRNVILFIGYQAEATLGRHLMDGAKRIKIFGRELPVRAQIRKINAFSAHTDQNGLVEWVASTFRNSPPEALAIIHGEENSREKLKTRLDFLGDTKIVLPKHEETFYF